MSIAALEPLATYLLAAMAGWSPPTSQPEGGEIALARYREIARDIARVALDPAEPPVFSRFGARKCGQRDGKGPVERPKPY